MAMYSQPQENTDAPGGRDTRSPTQARGGYSGPAQTQQQRTAAAPVPTTLFSGSAGGFNAPRLNPQVPQAAGGMAGAMFGGMPQAQPMQQSTLQMQPQAQGDYRSALAALMGSQVGGGMPAQPRLNPVAGMLGGGQPMPLQPFRVNPTIPGGGAMMAAPQAQQMQSSYMQDLIRQMGLTGFGGGMPQAPPPRPFVTPGLA